jgi:drug/metabolite transporter (DMT)-like permease
MVYLILCILINAFIGSIFKWFDKYGVEHFQAIVTNYFVCICMAGIVSKSIPIPSDLISKPWLGFAILTGVILIIVFNIMGSTIKTVGVGTATVFQKMSLIAPSLVAIFYYNEPTTAIKWLGIALAIIAIFLMCYPSSTEGHKSLHRNALLLCILTFVGSCFVDLAFFFIDKWGLAPNGDIQFLASLFLIAGTLGLLVILYQYFITKKTIKLRNIIGGICLGIPNFFSLYLIILSLQAGLDASIVFPVNNVGVLIGAAILGYTFFGERFSKIQIVGFGIAIAAIALINF